jgi:hypothetical protein
MMSPAMAPNMNFREYSRLDADRQLFLRAAALR